MKSLVFVKYSLVISFAIVVSNCSPVKNVKAQKPFDTKDKKIYVQDKKTYSIDNLGIYLSNEFDGARLNNVKVINDTLIDVAIYPENAPINNSAYYAFKIWSTTPKTSYIQFSYPKDYDHRYIPKLKSEHTEWKVIDSTNIIRKDSVFMIKVALTNKPLTIAAQEVTTYTDTKNWIKGIVSANSSIIHEKVIGKSVLGKELPMLDIYSGSPQNKEVIVLLSRQHPPEVTGFMAFQSFLTTILTPSALSDDFLKRYRILVFPILNPDGVDMGHWRHNAHGIDLNRDWGFYRQPEVKAVTKAIVKNSIKHKGNVILGIDFHSTQEDLYYTSHTLEGTSIPHFYDEWFEAIDQTFPQYKPNEIRDDSTQPVSKGWFLATYKATAITYEIGDETPRDFVKEKAKVAAIEMMKILNKR